MENKDIDGLEKLRNIIKEKIDGNDSEVFLFYRANKAIKEAVKLAKSMVISGKYDSICVISQDQGHWIGYKRAARDLNVDYKEIVTDDGVIITNALKKELDNIKEQLIVFFITQPAGYAFVQDMDKIYSIVNKFNLEEKNIKEKRKCILVADVSGSFSNKNQANFNNSDMMLGSFAEEKVVDLGYGGFLAVRKKLLEEIYEKTRFETEEKSKNRVDALLTENFEEQWIEKAEDAFNTVEKRLQARYGISSKLKEDLISKGFNVIKKDSLAINVIVESSNDDEQKRIIDFCKKNNYDYKECPMDIKVKKLGVSIELADKR